LKGSDPVRTVIENSIIKARDVLRGISDRETRYLVSSFDTVVVLGNRILGKPSDIEEAYSFIETLSGKVHRVITGICVMESVSGIYVTGREISKVRFRELTSDEIKNYLKMEFVLDKAGAYNIAGPGAMLVEKVKGCLFNIIGLPVFKYFSLLERFDYKTLYHSKE